MKDPPDLVHFNGTIFTFRVFQRSKGKPVVDELYRLLLISLLEELVPSANVARLTPPIGELAKGLIDDNAPVRYRKLRRPYVVFREQLDQLCKSPIFVGERGDKLIRMVAPFDEFYANIPLEVEPETAKMRFHGLG